MKDILIVSTPVVFKNKKGKRTFEWFIVKQQEDSNWELPKTIARRGESSVRSSIRLSADEGGMNAKVLEEVGRSGGAAKVNEKIVTQRHLYYLLKFQETAGTDVTFIDSEWMEYSKAIRKLTAKSDQTMLRAANKLVKTIDMEEEDRMQDERTTLLEEQKVAAAEEEKK